MQPNIYQKRVKGHETGFQRKNYVFLRMVKG
jgi:hypothetical protein